MTVYYIYQLVDPRDQQPRYVGITDNTIRRFKDYLHGVPHSRPLSRWLNELTYYNLTPMMEELEQIEGTREEAEVRERHWIRTCLAEGVQLLNKLNTQGDTFQQTVWMPKELNHRLKMHAARTGESVTSILTKLLEEYLKEVEG